MKATKSRATVHSPLFVLSCCCLHCCGVMFVDHYSWA